MVCAVPLIEMETLNGETVPNGVPGFFGVLLPPPPQAAPKARIANNSAANTKSRLFLRREANAIASADRRHNRAIPRGAFQFVAVGAVPEAAVELNVSVAIVVPFAGSVNAEIVQVISSVVVVPHVEDERLPEPVSPPTLVNVRVVEADWPGAEIVTELGFAETVKEGGAVTVIVTCAEVEER
jgi:hypothetical protein